MDTEILVEDRINEGRTLLAQLPAQGFDVSVAVWVQTGEDSPWYLYIASPLVGPTSIGDAYGIAYETLSRSNIASITPSDLRMVSPENPVAKDAISFRDRASIWIPTRYPGKRLGQLEINEAYIYPPITLGLNRTQILEALAHLMGRTGHLLEPSLVTLRTGASMKAIPVGIQLGPGGITVDLQDVTTGVNESFPIDEITNIQ